MQHVSPSPRLKPRSPLRAKLEVQHVARIIKEERVKLNSSITGRGRGAGNEGQGQGAKFAARGRMSGLPSLPPPVYSCREEKSCPFLDSQALADREREFSLWVSANECTILIIDCVNPVSFVCVNQQEQLRQLPYPVPIGLRQEDLDLDLEEEESAEDSEDLEEEGETLFNDDSDPMEASSVQDLAAVNESV